MSNTCRVYLLLYYNIAAFTLFFTYLRIQSGNSVVKTEAVIRDRRDVIPLTPTTAQKFLRHLVPLSHLIKSLGGHSLLPDVSYVMAILATGYRKIVLYTDMWCMYIANLTFNVTLQCFTCAVPLSA